MKHQGLWTYFFLKEAGATKLQQSCGQQEGQARTPQAVEENKETSLLSYTPPAAVAEAAVPTVVCGTHLYLQVLCAANLPKQGIPWLGTHSLGPEASDC